MQARALLTPLSAVAAIALLSCVDTTRPSASPSPDATADGSAGADATAEDVACQPPACAAWELAWDDNADGCMDSCQRVPCSVSCDCDQPGQDDSKSLCPSDGWPGFGLFAECEAGFCTGACGAIPTAVTNCNAPGTCPAGGPECAPWEEPLGDPITECVEDCETRCELDCDCYVALGDPDAACEAFQRSIWTCNDHHRCETSCVSLTDVPDCHGDRAFPCNDSDDCRDGALDGRNYCARPPGMCGDHDKGLCTSANDDPDKCPENGPAVCGCDGGIYTNLCRAIASGVSVRGPAAMCP